MKSLLFNGLLMAGLVLLAYLPMRSFPDFPVRQPATVAMRYRPVSLPGPGGSLRLAGAWELEADDPRLRGLSALTIDQGRFLAVSDLGAVVRFDPPMAKRPVATLSDLPDGPGEPGRKNSRDAESLVRDPHGRGWWVGFEQRHSLWLYDDGFRRTGAAINLSALGWYRNRGAEALLVEQGSLVVLAENGRTAVRIGQGGPQVLKLYAGADVADAARAPDGSAWLLLRMKGPGGVDQSIAQLRRTHDGYLADPLWQVPKAVFDNFEGLAITSLPDGSWRFWLLTDDGHRIKARTLLVALDLLAPIHNRHDKSPAGRAGLSKKPTVERP